MGDGGQAQGRPGHPHRPAVHPDLGDGRQAHPDPRRQRRRAARRADQLHPRQRPVVQGVRRRIHQRRDDRRARITGTPRTSTGCSPASTRRPARYDLSTWAYADRRGRRPREHRRPRPGTSTASASDRAAGDEHGSPAVRRCEHARVLRDETLQDPQHGVPDPQAALRPLHPGDGRRRLRHQPSTTSPTSRESVTENSGRERTTCVRLRRRLDPAHARRAVHPHRRRSCSCCSATWVAPAAASWRCAGTPASRARPTSRPCTTSCPATCRCPWSASTTRVPTTSDAIAQQGAEGLLGQRRHLRRQPAQGVVGRRRDAPRTTGPTTTCPGCPGRTAPTRPSMACSRTRSRATSSSARTRPSDRPTAGCSGWAWPTSSGWWCAIST